MPFSNILVVIDGSPCGQKALETAIELSKLIGCPLNALAVEGPLPAYAATVGEVEEVKNEKDAFFERIVQLARDEAKKAGVEIDVSMQVGHPAEVIVREVEAREADLVVVGHKDHFLGDYVLGSTADRVAHHAPCPVLIVR
jgi:nucleotide-binding universal stress UspA family protein